MTNETPAKSLFSRNFKSQLDLILLYNRMNDSVMKQEDHKACRSFQCGDIVWAMFLYPEPLNGVWQKNIKIQCMNYNWLVSQNVLMGGLNPMIV